MNQASFLAAIRQAPDDDTPRLVYADWLEDGAGLDSPTSHPVERAEFIRVQVELARGVRDNGRRLELLARLRELSQLYRREWLGPLEVWMPEAVFERGFVEYADTDAQRFVEQAARVFTAHPIHRLRLRHAAGWMERVASSPCLALLSGLDLRNNALLPDDVHALALSGHTHRLAHLDLSAAGLTLIELVLVVQSQALSNLRTMVVKTNNLRDEGAVAVSRIHGLPALERLDLSNNQITDEGAEALAAGVARPALTCLRLADNNLSLRGVEASLRSSALSGLTLLDVTYNRFDRQAALGLQRGARARLVF
jgi:uncharacterized protein (TIGR02996 family)